jgi:hypothetical protein
MVGVTGGWRSIPLCVVLAACAQPAPPSTAASESATASPPAATEFDRALAEEQCRAVLAELPEKTPPARSAEKDEPELPSHS